MRAPMLQHDDRETGKKSVTRHRAAMRSQSRKIPILWLPRHNDLTHIGFRRGPTVAASSSKIAHRRANLSNSTTAIFRQITIFSYSRVAASSGRLKQETQRKVVSHWSVIDV
jgi:hypothetical protein